MKLKFNADWHSYWLDGVRCKGATSIAGYPDNRAGLERWMKRMVLAGGARDPKLMERAAVYINDKTKLDDLAEQALELARANERTRHRVRCPPPHRTHRHRRRTGRNRARQMGPPSVDRSGRRGRLCHRTRLRRTDRRLPRPQDRRHIRPPGPPP